jgi:hypothetical protein
VSTEYEMKGLKILNYTSNSLDSNKKWIFFQMMNYWEPLSVTWGIQSDSFTNSSSVLMNNSNIVTVSSIVNYSTDGNKAVNVSATSGSIAAGYLDTFRLKALEINNYDRTEFNSTTRIIAFEAENTWPANLSVRWNISEPNIRNLSYLAQNKSVMVIIEQNYSEGRKEAEVKVSSGNFLTTFKDRFNILFVQLLNLQILQQSRQSTVAELTAQSHSGNKSMGWAYNSGREAITSSKTFFVNESKDVMVIIEANYTSSAVYNVSGFVNSSTYSDSAKGVVIT